LGAPFVILIVLTFLLFGGGAVKMRMTSLVGGLAFVLASCGGGEKKTQEQTTATPEQKPAPAAPAPTGTRKTHDVNMDLDGSSFKYVPNALVIRSGDVVRFYNKGGGPHNVSFWPDSIPRGAAAALVGGMPNQMALQGPLLADPGSVYQVSFARAPTGEYKFYCLTHLALGMKGNLTVE
jgi:plastocyanin